MIALLLLVAALGVAALLAAVRGVVDDAESIDRVSLRIYGDTDPGSRHLR